MLILAIAFRELGPFGINLKRDSLAMVLHLGYIKKSGRSISGNLSDLHLFLTPSCKQVRQSLHQEILGEMFSVKSSCALHQDILGDFIS